MGDLQITCEHVPYIDVGEVKSSLDCATAVSQLGLCLQVLKWVVMSLLWRDSVHLVGRLVVPKAKCKVAWVDAQQRDEAYKTWGFQLACICTCIITGSLCFDACSLASMLLCHRLRAQQCAHWLASWHHLCSTQCDVYVAANASVTHNLWCPWQCSQTSSVNIPCKTSSYCNRTTFKRHMEYPCAPVLHHAVRQWFQEHGMMVRPMPHCQCI